MNKNFKSIKKLIVLFLVSISLLTGCQFDNINKTPIASIPPVKPDIPEEITPINKNVILGIPEFTTDGFTDIETNYKIERDSYVLSYNNDLHRPNWVAWHLEKDDIGSGRYKGDFFVDEALPYEWEKVGHRDLHFTTYGFDRGHMCPNGDRNAEADVPYVLDTFYMTNIIPQAPQNNQGPWKDLEDDIRDNWISAGYEAYIVSGASGIGGKTNKGYCDYIYSISEDDNNNPDDDEIKIAVPKDTWKVVLAIKYGNDDLSRFENTTEVISFGVIMPNDTTCNGNWQDYIYTIDEIEAFTDIDFYTELSEAAQAFLESEIRL